jgi:LysR family hydrogen peroxide-inducible transcriptional activator
MASLTQLEYILAVEKHRHFGKAAKACHVSQPTLSQQIQKLEDDLDIVIFDRLQKPVIPTEEGIKFVNQAKVVINEHERLLHFAKSGAEGVTGDFRLAIIPTISSFLIPHFIGDFAKHFPKVELFIEEYKTETIMNELRNDRIDGAILATPTGETGFKEHPLYYEPMVVYAAANHPLLKKSKINPKDMDASELWLLKDGNCFKDQVANFCAISPTADTVFTNIHFQSGNLEVLKNIVFHTRGYTLIPAMMMQFMSKSEVEKHVRPFSGPAPVREVSFVYRRDHWKIEIIRAIKDMVLKNLPDSVFRQKSKDQLVLEIC